jgi:hypothetical protein
MFLAYMPHRAVLDDVPETLILLQTLHNQESETLSALKKLAQQRVSNSIFVWSLPERGLDLWGISSQASSTDAGFIVCH